MIKSILKQKRDSFIYFINMNEYNSFLAKGPDQHLWKSFISHVYVSKPTSPNPSRLTKEG